MSIHKAYDNMSAVKDKTVAGMCMHVLQLAGTTYMYMNNHVHKALQETKERERKERKEKGKERKKRTVER